MQTVLHGIPNCDTVRKARAWLDANGVEYTFHDYKTLGIDAAKLGDWANSAGWEALLNRAGTTFRKLPESAKHDLTAARALKLMREQPSLIKRPVLVTRGQVVVGFDPGTYSRLF
jgi:arsenate reductase (glutaredoxin)